MQTDLLEKTIAQTVADTYTSPTVPPIDHGAIRARIGRKRAREFHLAPRFAFAALVLIACAVLAVPQVFAKAAIAAESFLIRIVYVTFGSHGRNEQLAKTITLEQAAGTTAFTFIQPHGLPQGAQVATVLQAPSNVGGAITIAYRVASGKTFTITESHAPTQLTITRCFPTALNGSPQVSKALASDPQIQRAHFNHQRFNLDVIFSNTCPTPWLVGATQITLTNSGDALSATQLRSIMSATNGTR